MTRYFVMLNGGGGLPVVMTVGYGANDELEEYSEDPMMFETEEEANAAGVASSMGSHRGYTIYPWDWTE